MATRAGGLAFAIITLAEGVVLYTVIINLGFLGGGIGMFGVPLPTIAGLSLLGSERSLYFFALGLAGLSYLAAGALVGSPVGGFWRAIRDDRVRAQSIGIDVRRYEVLAFVVAGVIGALGGVAYVTLNAGIGPTQFDWTQSGLALVILIIGGSRHPLRRADRRVHLRLRVQLPDVQLREQLAGVLRRAVRRARAAAARRGRRGDPAHHRPAAQGPGMTAVLEITGLAKRFGELRVLDGIELTVADRGVHSIIGPNGAGKTTLFNCITGLVQPDRGRVTLAGGTSPGSRWWPGCASAWSGRSRSAGCSTACRRGSVSGWRCSGPSCGAGSGCGSAGPHGTGSGSAPPNCWPRSGSGRPAGTGRAARCPRPTGARSRWRWRWPANRSCCAWTSLRQASAWPRRSGWPS